MSDDSKPKRSTYGSPEFAARDRAMELAVRIAPSVLNEMPLPDIAEAIRKFLEGEVDAPPASEA